MPSVYFTLQRKLKVYKSLDAYKYFTSSWVSTYFIHEVINRALQHAEGTKPVSRQPMHMAITQSLGCCEKEEWFKLHCSLHMHAWLGKLTVNCMLSAVLSKDNISFY